MRSNAHRCEWWTADDRWVSAYQSCMWEGVDAMMDSYKETLESIKKGVLYSKDDGDGDTYSMIPPTEDVVSSYSVDVTKA